MNEVDLLDRLHRTSDLRIEPPLRAMGAGFRNLTYLSPDGWLVRAGRTRDDGRALLEEAQLLKRIAPEVAFEVPGPAFVEHSDAFPTGVMVYRAIPGSALNPADPAPLTLTIAERLARALVELHGLAAPRSLRRSPSQHWRRWLAQPRDWLDGALAAEERSALDAWVADLEAEGALERFAPRIVHGDLWFDHVLVDRVRGRLSGIVDFGDAGLGDPAQDLATQLHMGRDFFNRVIAFYTSLSKRTDPTLERRIRRRWELRELHGIWWAWRRRDRGEFEDALAKLRRGAVLAS